MSLVHHTDDSPGGCALAAVVLAVLWCGGIVAFVAMVRLLDAAT